MSDGVIACGCACGREDGRAGHDLTRKVALTCLCVSVRRVRETEREKEKKGL